MEEYSTLILNHLRTRTRETEHYSLVLFMLMKVILYFDTEAGTGSHSSMFLYLLERNLREFLLSPFDKNQNMVKFSKSKLYFCKVFI